MKNKQIHKLFVRKVLGREQVTDEFGRQHIILKTIKEEVSEINLGSINNPNKDIVEIDFQPIMDKKI